MDKNNYFNSRQGGSQKSGKSDYFDDPYRRTRRVSVNAAGTGGGGYKRTPKRRIPVALAIVIDILVAGLIFLLFYFTQFNYSGSSEENNTPSISETSISSASPADTQNSPSASQTAEASSTPVSTASASIDPNNWRAKFASKFSSDGKVHQQNNADSWIYQSPNISVNITKKTDNGVVYFVTDIYIADIKYFKTWYTEKFDSRLFVSDALQQAGGVVGVNGDFFPNNGGLTIRNGQYVAYKASMNDELVMYNDGTMQVFTAANFDYNNIKAQAPDTVYQVWGFGPILLDNNGQPLTRFNSTVNSANNSRTAIGYYEPGHYCFVSVDGRQQGYSYPGYSMSQLANLMNTLGCKLAFNLDGGGSEQLAFMGNEINQPPSDKRKDYDILYITDQG